MEAFESAGEWWLPEATDSAVVGLVAFEPSDGFRLEIPYGALGPADDFIDRMNNGQRSPLVHGALRDGRVVTLVNVVLGGSTVQLMGGAQNEQHWSLKGFVGPVPCVADPPVRIVRVRHVHLRDWVVLHPSRMEWPFEGDRPSSTVRFEYVAPELQHLASGEGWTLRLVHTALQTTPSVAGFNVSHDCELELEFDEPLPYSEVDARFLSPLWQFLSVCLDQSVHVSRLRIRPDGTDQWFDVGHAQTLCSKPDEIITSPFMLLSMPQLGDRLESVLIRWLELSGDERRAVSLLAGLLSERTVPSDLRFLASAQALEAMARIGAEERELEEDEFQRRLALVTSSIEERRVRDWAERKLRFSNSRATGELVRELLADIGPYVNECAPDLERFLRDYRDNRNFYTHRDDRRASQLLEPGELFILTQGILLLLKAGALRMLGFSQDQVAEVMNACQGALQWRLRVANQYSVDSGESA